MEKKPVLPLILQIVTLVLLLITTLLTLAMGYIMFAPDNLPKPFYLSYIYPTPMPVDENGQPIVEEVIPTEEPTPVPGSGIMVNNGTKIINLADPGGRRYIRITIVLEIEPPHATTDDEKAASGGHGGEEEELSPADALASELATKTPIMDDVIITLISQKTYEDLYTAQGKENLRLEIMNKLNERLPEYHIMSIYFTEFVVE